MGTPPKSSALKGGETKMLTKERKGEIAYELWKLRMKKDGIRLDGLNREIGNITQATDILTAELHEFMREITNELVEEAFGITPE